MALRSVLFVLTLAGLLAVVLQPGRKNPTPVLPTEEARKTGGLDRPLALVALAGDLSGAPLRGLHTPAHGSRGDSLSFPLMGQPVTALPLWTVGDCPVPLPSGLTAGEYLVTSSHGAVGRLIVPASRTRSVVTPSAEVHTLTVGTVAWVFVRQGDVQGTLPTVSSQFPSRPLFLNRKFDFAGVGGHASHDLKLGALERPEQTR